MTILVDYDNSAEVFRRKGIVFFADKVLQCIGPNAFEATRGIRIRLYGGWYERSLPTRRAQALAATIEVEFPRLMSLAGMSSPRHLLTNVELAYSLEVDPSRHLWHTFRRRQLPRGLSCQLPSAVGCSDPACPLGIVHDFLKTGKCPVPGCTITPEDIIHRDEQKLVDTMLTADIICLAYSGEKTIVVVSSDDDLWPGIRTALSAGSAVIHVHTSASRRTPPFYHSGVANYVQRNL
jgi:uncharacterized LabA/DUF88 family protein